MSGECSRCWIPLIVEGDETPSTIRQIEVMPGVCLQCNLIATDVTFWQHAESDCVFLGPPEATLEHAIQEFYYECDGIPVDLFFARIEQGYSFDLNELLGPSYDW